MRRPSLVLTLALAGAVALSACDDQPAQFDGSDDASSQPEQSPVGAEEPVISAEAEEADDEASVEADSAAAAGVDLTEVPDPLVSATVPATVEGDPDATLQVNLHSLVRDGDVVVGTFSFVVASEASGTDRNWLYDYLDGHIWQPHFIDTVNLTRHDVPAEATGVNASVTDSQSFTFLPGQTVYGYALFASPPEDVTTVMLSMVDGAPAAEVELQ